MIEFIVQYWVQVALGLIVTSFGAIVKWLHSQWKLIKALKLGMQAMLRNEIIEQYNKYIDRGYIPIYALENVESMYTQYHALGGNGTVTHLFEELQDLPTKKEVLNEKTEKK